MTTHSTEVLINMVNGLIRRLRQTAPEPFQIEVSDEIYVEILPIGYLDDRVYVGKREHGFTEVNYSADGLNVEVLSRG